MTVALRSGVASVAVVLGLAGCVPVPTTGTLESVKTEGMDIAALPKGSKVAVLSAKPIAGLTMQKCVVGKIAEELGDDRVLAADKAYEDYYPIVEKFSYLQEGQLGPMLAEPVIAENVQKNKIKYLVVVSEPIKREKGDSAFLLVGALVDARSYTSISAHVIDVEQKRKISDVTVEASAYSGGFVTIAVIYSVVAVPLETDMACEVLGSRLGKAFRTGKLEIYEKPKLAPVNSDPPENGPE